MRKAMTFGSSVIHVAIWEKFYTNSPLPPRWIPLCRGPKWRGEESEVEANCGNCLRKI